ncbi:hypothetical protein H4R19_006449, partial [Coemansia spiralis]
MKRRWVWALAVALAWPFASGSTTDATKSRTVAATLQTVVLNLAQADAGAVKECQKQCADSRCRGQCQKTGLTDEAILRRTQRCTESCRDKPTELVHMCIQRCTYYLVDPVGNTAEAAPESSVGKDGLLVDNEHVRTRIRLIGPDGLPLQSTAAASSSSTRSRPADGSDSDDSDDDEDSSYSSRGRYRVVLVSGGEAAPQRGQVVAAAVAAVLTWLG